MRQTVQIDKSGDIYEQAVVKPALSLPSIPALSLLYEVCYNIEMKLMKDHVKLSKMTDADDVYVRASPAERVGFVWELTEELWSLRNRQDAERRLQRNVATLIRQQR
jgi:hypothetical protein